jgi:formate hydrogenlyase subunit 3/multisubunit Na+/H+ antiporter MnhD subunit
MGYILFGIGSLTEQGMVGSIMHVVYHAIVKALLFMVVGIIIATTEERQIEKLSGLGKVLPVTTVCAAIGALGISGMPPLGIFNSEWMIFAGGFGSGYSPILTILTLIGSLFTVVYALRFFGKIFLGKLGAGIEPKASPKALLVPTLAVTIFLIIEGLLPAPLLSWAINGLAVVFGGSS